MRQKQGRSFLSLVKGFISQHPEKKIVMGEVKERHSGTRGRNYMSFGCPNCDAIVGSFYLHDIICMRRQRN